MSDFNRDIREQRDQKCLEICRKLEPICNEDHSVIGLTALLAALAIQTGETIAIMESIPEMMKLFDKAGTTPHQYWDEFFAAALHTTRNDIKE
jgi:hypothetical protein